MYRTILVPLDGSPLGEQALPGACALARRAGATLDLAHVSTRAAADPIWVEGLPVIDEQMHSLGALHDRAYLERVRARLIAEGPLAVRVTALDERDAEGHDQSVAGTLARHIAASGADLVVMTSHGRGGLARFWLGSVADALVRMSPAPILLLRSGEEALGRGVAPPLSHILVPLDGSARSEAILAHAAALGGLTGAAYTLLHVVVPAALGPAAPFTTPTDFDPERTERERAEAQGYLDALAAELGRGGAKARALVLVSEQAAPAILEVGRREGADLIAMSTAGRSGMRRLLIGSVADKVLRRAEVPLLLHRDDAA